MIKKLTVAEVPPDPRDPSGPPHEHSEPRPDKSVSPWLVGEPEVQVGSREVVISGKRFPVVPERDRSGR